VDITVKVIQEYFDDEVIGILWKRLMVSFPFRAKFASQIDVNYQVGQPMGLYSSWPSMAMTNHVMVRMAGNRLGINKFGDYLIIGDDIVIYNEKVAYEYISIIESAGIQWKPADSIWPRSSHPCEIAKRVFRNGIEVSSIPWNLRKTNEGLFYYYLLSRGDSKSLLTRCILESTSVSLNAALLMKYYESRTDWLVSFTSGGLPQHDTSVGSASAVADEMSYFVFDESYITWYLFMLYCTHCESVSRDLWNDMNNLSGCSNHKLVNHVRKQKSSGHHTAWSWSEILAQRKFFNLAVEHSVYASQQFLDKDGIDTFSSLWLKDAKGESHWIKWGFVEEFQSLTDHHNAIKDLILIQQSDILTNPIHQIQNVWILKWESSLSLLNSSELNHLNRFLISQLKND
jgi:hypothetical protein